MNTQPQLKVDQASEVTVVRLPPRPLRDIQEIERLGKELYQLIEDHRPMKVVLDFAPVEFLSSAAFGKLISLNRRAQAYGGTLRLCNLSSSILQVFRVCRLDRVFDIRSDETDALSSFA